MAVTYAPNHNDALLQALEAILKEEAEAIKDLAIVQSRIENLRAAKNAMRSLMPKNPFDVPEQQSIGLSDQLGRGVYEGMKFTKALKLFMDSQTEPLSTKDATIAFEQSGWKFTADTLDNKMNQVGVSFRRNEGDLFRRVDGTQQWVSIGGIAELM